jgi:hypothetical protein
LFVASKEKDVGFAWLPLTTKEGAVITDGEYNLQFYSMPKEKEAVPGFYMKEGIVVWFFFYFFLSSAGIQIDDEIVEKRRITKNSYCFVIDEIDHVISLIGIVKLAESSKPTVRDAVKNELDPNH